MGQYYIFFIPLSRFWPILWDNRRDNKNPILSRLLSRSLSRRFWSFFRCSGLQVFAVSVAHVSDVVSLAVLAKVDGSGGPASSPHVVEGSLGVGSGCKNFLSISAVSLHFVSSLGM